MSAPEVWATAKNLPPGLWLPTAEEPTDKYLATNFENKDLPYDNVVDLGTFAVALAFYKADNSGRVSLMPTAQDFNDLYEEGYGLPKWKIGRYHGGLAKLQRELGFFPREYDPSVDEIIHRCVWVNRYAYHLDPLQVDELSLPLLLSWGSARHLTPSTKKVYRAMDGDTSILRNKLQLERRYHHHQNIYTEIYQFGAQVIEEHGGPISIPELNRLYPDVFVGKPSHTISYFMDGFTAFWGEFGYFPDKICNLTANQMVSIAVRRLVFDERLELTGQAIDRMSANRQFFSQTLIHNRFKGGLREFQDRVNAEYKIFLHINDKLAEQGVNVHVCEVISQRYDVGAEFEETLQNNINVLKKLSQGSESARYVLGIMQKGFNLLDAGLMDLQFSDMKKCLKRLNISDESELRFIFDIVPRFNTDEAIQRLRNTN